MTNLKDSKEADPLRTMMEERCRREEIYVFQHQGRTYRWDLAVAWRLLLVLPRETIRFKPSEQRVTLEHVMSRYPDLDLEYAKTCDLTLPLLFVPFAGRHQLIDGWHRLAKVLLEEATPGSAELSAFVLTQAEADAIRQSEKRGMRP